jgi:peptidoglycan hydrolase CwlO-like protein
MSYNLNNTQLETYQSRLQKKIDKLENEIGILKNEFNNFFNSVEKRITKLEQDVPVLYEESDD